MNMSCIYNTIVKINLIKLTINFAALFSIVTVSITTIGSPTAGVSYTLKCSVSGTSDPASYQWFGPNGESITNSSSRMVFSNSSLTLLQFSPLQASHGGLYTCRASVGGVINVTNTYKGVKVQSECRINYNVIISRICYYSSHSPCSNCCDSHSFV